MTKALLLVSVGFYSTSVPLMAAGGNTITATCTPGKTVITKVNAVGSINVQCPPDLKIQLSYKASKPPSQAPVLPTPDFSADTWEISDVCPGASWVKHDNGSGCRVEIPELPPGPVKFYFPCMKGLFVDEKSQANSCYIGIEVAAAEGSGLNICAIDGGRMDISIEKANESLSFACRDESKLYPSDRKKTFDALCKKEVALREEAALIEENGRYTLTVQKLPAQGTEICYICMGKDKDSRCEVHIAVSGSEISGAVSESVAARTAAALGLTLVAFGFLLVC